MIRRPPRLGHDAGRHSDDPQLAGTAIGLFGLAAGIPLGLAVGRLGWHAVRQGVAFSEVAPFALAAILIIIPAMLLAANVLALWPGRVALSHTPAEKLRTE